MPVAGPIYDFTKANVDESPEEPGVYCLLDGNVVIYYGESHDDTVRARLQRHQSGAAGACTQKATHFKCEVCDDPEAREEELLEAYEKKYGKLPKCNSRRT